MKKIFMVLICFSLAVSAFAGGNRDAGGAAPGGQTGLINPKGKLPLSDGKTTLTVFVSSNSASPRVTSLSVTDNLFTQKVVKETGINLEIEYGGLESQERINILLNTGTYPDIVISNLSKNDLLYYASQGIFIPLNKYDPLSFPNIGDGFTRYPWVAQNLSDANGNLYSLPTVNECIQCVYSNGRFWFYNPWIRETGRKVPDTLDEYRDYLKFVKATDLNKNGRNDEIPLAFAAGDLNNVVAFFANAYLPFAGTAVENTNVVDQYRDPRFREALKFMNSLYKEGLILTDSFTMTGDQLRALITSETPVLGAAGTSWINAYAIPLTPRFPEWMMQMPLAGPGGVRYAGNGAPWGQGYPRYMITDKCKNPELAIALYDYFLDFSVSLDSWAGPKGIGWADPDPGARSMAGTATYKKLLTEETVPINSYWGQAAPSMTNANRMQQLADVENMAKYLTTGDTSLAPSMAANASFLDYMFITKAEEQVKWAKPDSIFLPPLSLSDADNARVSDINAVLNSYRNKALTEFITGITDINSDAAWNTYIAELDRLGAGELISIQQKYIK
jgi:putative aldouronate transport system substrate-binding protein